MSTICLPRLNQACPNPKAAKSLGSGPSPAGRQSGITVRRLGGLVGYRQPTLASPAEPHARLYRNSESAVGRGGVDLILALGGGLGAPAKYRRRASANSGLPASTA